jgi:hypothetical protein
MALSGLAIQGFLVYDAHRTFTKTIKLPTTPILIRIPSAYDNNASSCFHSPSVSKRARLEPPGDTFLWGFHLQWDVDKPEQIVKRLNGRKPAIIK